MAKDGPWGREREHPARTVVKLSIYALISLFGLILIFALYVVGLLYGLV